MVAYRVHHEQPDVIHVCTNASRSMQFPTEFVRWHSSSSPGNRPFVGNRVYMAFGTTWHAYMPGPDTIMLSGQDEESRMTAHLP